MQSLTGRLLNLGGARVDRADSTLESRCSIRMLAVRFKVESHENLSCYCCKSVTAPSAACRGAWLTESWWLKARHVVSYRPLGPASAMLLSGTITALKNARRSSLSCRDRNGMSPAFSLHSFVRSGCKAPVASRSPNRLMKLAGRQGGSSGEQERMVQSHRQRRIATRAMRSGY
jgi:hypothetical protein